ncbi:hypothetical protein L596_027231 [Steinernema carpocapsae]|uniref:Uncharacterized protein n=1 Tax=Steinernema carpocapsae TaxID=34508 RepID=A0A4V5ZYE3_STECR|nr:hypothetical protein L596_027231 [Steinernema carpocapsae]
MLLARCHQTSNIQEANVVKPHIIGNVSGSCEPWKLAFSVVNSQNSQLSAHSFHEFAAHRASMATFRLRKPSCGAKLIRRAMFYTSDLGYGQDPESRDSSIKVTLSVLRLTLLEFGWRQVP